MTSEEIKNLQRGFGDALDWTEDAEQFAHRAIDGIWEIAYQLAVANECKTSGVLRGGVKGHAISVQYGSMTTLRCACGWSHTLPPGVTDTVANECFVEHLGNAV